MRRLVIVAIVWALASAALAAPAMADDVWGQATCDEVPTPQCELEAGKGQQPGGPPASVPVPKPEGRQGGGRSNRVPAVPDVTTAKCSYVRSDFTPPPGGVMTISYRRPLIEDGMVRTVSYQLAPSQVRQLPAAEPPPGGDGGNGAWYLWKCTGKGEAAALYRAPVWIPDGQVPGAAAGPSPAELAELARKQLTLPSPVIATSPAGQQLVNLPTWLWVADTWNPVTATATAPGVTVTARAVPESLIWAMGDGGSVTCRGPGGPYVAGVDPMAESPDCGYVYRTSSATQPGQAFAVAVSMRWTVTWAGAGQGGAFPGLTTTGATTFRVAEAQALVTGGR